MINPRNTAVLILDRTASHFEDKTRDVSEIRFEGQRIEILFIRSNKVFGYGRDRVRVLRDPQQYAFGEGDQVEVNGSAWQSATELWIFTGNGEPWRVIHATAR